MEKNLLIFQGLDWSIPQPSTALCSLTPAPTSFRPCSSSGRTTTESWQPHSVGVLRPRSGQKVKRRIRIKLPSLSNWAQFEPKLATVDVIQGAIIGRVAKANTFATPTTVVVRTYAVLATSGSTMFEFIVTCVEQPIYFRVCGSDGKRTAAGLIASANNVSGPATDVIGSADP